MDRSLHFDNTALRVLGVRLLVFGNNVQAFYDGALFLYKHLDDFAGFAFVLAGVYIDGVAFLDM